MQQIDDTLKQSYSNSSINLQFIITFEIFYQDRQYLKCQPKETKCYLNSNQCMQTIIKMFIQNKRGLSRSQKTKSVVSLVGKTGMNRSNISLYVLKGKDTGTKFEQNKLEKEYCTPRKLVKEQHYGEQTTQSTKKKLISHRIDRLRKPILNSPKLKEVRVNRGRLIDWFFEICFNCRLSWSTFWASVQMMDALIINHGSIDIKTIHFTGSVCLFMSSKIHQNKPLKLKEVVESILHSSFTKKQVIQQQRDILMKLANSSNQLPSLTIYELFTDYFETGERHQVAIGLMQLSMLWMDLSKTVPEKKSLQSVFKQVVQCVLQEKIHQKAKEAYDHFFKNYKCHQILTYYKMIKW